MRRLLLIGLLVASFLVAANNADGKKKQHFKHSHTTKENGKHSNAVRRPDAFYGPAQQIAPQFGEAGREYHFRFDSQTTSGFASWISTQRATSRFQALVNVQFVSNREAEMRLSECLAGQLNGEPQQAEEARNPAKIQKIETFETDAKFQHEQLERPVRFTYERGAIENIRFGEGEPAWSKNVKKAVLSMMQLETGRDGVRRGMRRDPVERRVEEELRAQTDTIGGKQQQNGGGMDGGKSREQRERERLQSSYTLTEMTIEGECECVYAMVPIGNGAELVNVTKSINFDRCRMLADVAFGMQADEEAKLRGEQKARTNAGVRHREDRMAHMGPEQLIADAEWRNKSASPMIAKQVLDRSTTIRYVLSNQEKNSNNNKNDDADSQPGLDAYGIQQVELVSQYVLKGSEAESSQAQQTVAAAKLRFLGSSKLSEKEEKGKNKNDGENRYEEEGESLLYNADMESQEKCFFMFGDDDSDARQCRQFGQQSSGKTTNGQGKRSKTPYGQNYPSAEAKIGRAAELLARVARAQQQQGNVEADEEEEQNGRQERETSGPLNTAEHMDELVGVLRFCTEQELQQLQTKIAETGDKRAEQFYADALAAAGTRNTLKVLLKRIEAGEFGDLRAAHLMKIFSRGSGLPAPSDKIVDLVLAACKTGRVQKSRLLKQACWLSFGAIVGELNQQQRIVRYSPVRTPVSAYEICPAHKMELYTKALLDEFTAADEDTQFFEKVIALKAIGNAALDNVPQAVADCVNPEGAAEQRDQPPPKHDVFRQNAMEAMRRIPSLKVQKLLAPIYLNQREKPMTRMLALSVLVQSQLAPSPTVLDQIAYAMVAEKCPQVLAYTQSTLRELARSPAKRHQEIAQHIQSALRLVGADEEELKAKCRGADSKFERSVLYSQKEESGAFIEIAKVFPGKSFALPVHYYISLSSLLNGQFSEEKLKLTFCQRNLDRLFASLMGEDGEDWQEGGETEGEKKNGEKKREGSSSSSSSEEEGTKSRSYFSTAKQQLRSIWSSLKGIVKSKQQTEEEEQQKFGTKEPIVSMALRINNVDTAVWVFRAGEGGKQAMMERLREMLAMAGAAQNAADYAANGVDQPAVDFNGIMFWQERAARIPISTGQQLNIQQKSTLFGHIRASVRQLGSAQLAAELHSAMTYAAGQKMKVWSSPVHASGVKRVMAVQAVVPMKGQLSVRPQQKQIKLSMHVPQSATRLFAFHTLPSTFVNEIGAEIGSSSNHKQSNNAAQSVSSSTASLPRHHFGERVRAIQNQQLRDHQFGIHKIAYRHIGLPIRVQGIMHRPREFTQLKEWAKVLLASENHYHVDFVPRVGQSPREIALTLGWDLFAISATSPAKTMQTKLAEIMQKFEAEGEQQSDDSETESRSAMVKRKGLEAVRQQLTRFTQQQAYKHTLRVTLETVGGEQNKRAELQVDHVCTGAFAACETHIQARSISGASGNEPADFQADVRIQTLLPPAIIDFATVERQYQQQQQQQSDSINSHNNNNEEQHYRMFIGKADAEWAAKGQAKQFIKLSVKGEPSQEMAHLHVQFTRAQYQATAASNSNPIARSQARAELAKLPRNAGRPFLNAYAMHADYQLGPAALNFFHQTFEHIKLQNFMNSQYEYGDYFNEAPEQQQQQGEYVNVAGMEGGQVRARLGVDPITQRHLNLTIRTDTQRVTFKQVELPVAIRPHPFRAFSLITTPTSPLFAPHRPASSLRQMLHQKVGYGLRARAQCRVETAAPQMETFDGRLATEAEMAAIPNCWILLAKPCPVDGQGKNENGNAIDAEPEYAVLIKSIPGSQQKMLKVVTSEMGVLLIEPKQQQQGEEGGEGEGIGRLQVRLNDQAQPITSDMSDALIPDGIEFAQSSGGGGNGGHESVVIESENGHFQVRFNGQTVRIRLSGAEYQNRQCGLCGNWDGEASNDFAQMPNGQLATNGAIQFQRAHAIEQADQPGCTRAALDQFYANQAQKQRQQQIAEEQQEQENGGQQQRKQNEKEDEDNNEQEEEEGEEIAPQERTKVIEYAHQLCFSMRPIQQCPVGSYASQRGQNGAEKKQQKVPFTCVDRASIEAKRLKQQARRGERIQLADYPASFQEMVVIPERCVKY